MEDKVLLNQLMHLVQDMSVPEHTRDDGHV